MKQCRVTDVEVPRWEKQCDVPHAGSWAVSASFSPSAPWGWDELNALYSTPQSAVYVSSPSEEIFGRFQRALHAHELVITPLPTAAEIRDLIDRVANRTPADEKAIVDQVDTAGIVGALVARVVPTLSFELDDLITWVIGDAFRPLYYAKARYNRVRAYQLFPELAPPFLPRGKFPMHAAFPSGHSTQAHMIVNVLASVFGAQVVESARDLAWEIGRNREIAGLHYASDTEGGRLLADVLLAEAETNPKFLADRNAVRVGYGIAPKVPA